MNATTNENATGLTIGDIAKKVAENKKAVSNVANVAPKIGKPADELYTIIAVIATLQVNDDATEEEPATDEQIVATALEIGRSTMLKMIVDNHLMILKLQADKKSTGNKKADKFIELPEHVHSMLKAFWNDCQVKTLAGTGKTGKDGKETTAIKSRSFSVETGSLNLNPGDIAGKFSEMFDSLKANTTRKTSFENALTDEQMSSARTFVLDQFKAFIKAIDSNINPGPAVDEQTVNGAPGAVDVLAADKAGE